MIIFTKIVFYRPETVQYGCLSTLYFNYIFNLERLFVLLYLDLKVPVFYFGCHKPCIRPKTSSTN